MSKAKRGAARIQGNAGRQPIGEVAEVAVSETDTRVLDTLSAEFDAWLLDMQRPDVLAGIERGFTATPDEMGRAAVAGARRSRSGIR